MRFGVATIAGIDLPLAEVLDGARSADLSFVELSERASHAATRSEDVVELAAERELAVDVLGSYLGFAGPIGDVQVASALRRASELGARLVRVWAADAAGPGLVQALRSAAEHAADEGLALTLERHRGGSAASADDVERLLDTVGHPALALCWQPLDYPDPAYVAGFVADAERLLPRANHIHVKNYVARGSGPRELGGPIRGGLLDWAPIVDLAQALAPSASMAIEFVEASGAPFRDRLCAAAVDLRSGLEGS